MLTVAPEIPFTKAFETFERFDSLYDQYQAARASHFDRYAAGELSAEEVDDLDREARLPLLSALTAAGVSVGIYMHDRQCRATLARTREARERARAVIAERERARIQSAVEATVRFAEVLRELGVGTLAEARAALEAKLAELEERVKEVAR